MLRTPSKNKIMVLSLISAKKSFCQTAIVLCSFTNKFQPLEITAKLIEKCAKSFISNKYNTWFSEQTSHQLQKGIQPADIKESLGITELKAMHAGWIVDLHQHFSRQCRLSLTDYCYCLVREVKHVSI